jgi:two-component system response regulator MprA
VLLAEDHDDLRLAIGRVLRVEGARIESARDGSQALSLVRGGGFDVVLMDVNMPKLDGLEATRLLRAEGCQVPIIALSADASAESRTDSIDAGCSGFLSKPFDADDLVASIRFLRRGEIDAPASQQS